METPEESIYMGGSCRIRIDGRGVEQGSVLSPALFLSDGLIPCLGSYKRLDWDLL